MLSDGIYYVINNWLGDLYASLEEAFSQIDYECEDIHGDANQIFKAMKDAIHKLGVTSFGIGCDYRRQIHEMSEIPDEARTLLAGARFPLESLADQLYALIEDNCDMFPGILIDEDIEQNFFDLVGEAISDWMIKV